MDVWSVWVRAHRSGDEVCRAVAKLDLAELDHHPYHPGVDDAIVVAIAHDRVRAAGAAIVPALPRLLALPFAAPHAAGRLEPHLG